MNHDAIPLLEAENMSLNHRIAEVGGDLWYKFTAQERSPRPGCSAFYSDGFCVPPRTETPQPL